MAPVVGLITYHATRLVPLILTLEVGTTTKFPFPTAAEIRAFASAEMFSVLSSERFAAPIVTKAMPCASAAWKMAAVLMVAAPLTVGRAVLSTKVS